ncbi:unnamed protein product [Caretta caretta]
MLWRSSLSSVSSGGDGVELQELELRLVLSVYADNVLLVVQDPGDLGWRLARPSIGQPPLPRATGSRALAWRSGAGGRRSVRIQPPKTADGWNGGDRVYFSHLTVRTAGVATLFSPDLRPKVLGVAKAVSGHLLHLQVCMEGLVVNLINIYALISGPERLRFYQQASAFLSTLDPRKCLILGRDFNTTLEEWDHLGTEQCPATAGVLREIVDHHSLVDIWRDQHPDNISKFTFVRVEAHQSHHSQLDHIYLSRFHLSWAHSSASSWPRSLIIIWLP